MEDQVYDQTILIKIHFQKYSISCRELDMVFSRFGALEKLETLSPRSNFHSRICFQNIESARMAIESLNHQCIYDNCCRLELFLMREIMIEPSKKVENECNSTGIVGIQGLGNLDSSLQKTQNNVGIQELESFDSSVQETQGNNTIEVVEDPEVEGGSSKVVSTLLTEFVVETEVLETEMQTKNEFYMQQRSIEDDEIPELLFEKWNWQAVDSLGMENLDVNISDVKELEPKSVEGSTEPYYDLKIDDTFGENLKLETIPYAGASEKVKESANSSHVQINESQGSSERSYPGKGDFKEGFLMQKFEGSWNELRFLLQNQDVSWKDFNKVVCVQFDEKHRGGRMNGFLKLDFPAFEGINELSFAFDPGITKWRNCCTLHTQCSTSELLGCATSVMKNSLWVVDVKCEFFNLLAAQVKEMQSVECGVMEILVRNDVEFIAILMPYDRGKR